MSGIKDQLIERSGNVCELCAAADVLSVYIVQPKEGNAAEECVLTCATCSNHLNEKEKADANHWRCLNDSMWNENDAVKVVAYRLLHEIKDEGWPQDLLDMIYLEDDAKTWAERGMVAGMDKHKDSLGIELHSGDSIVLIKDLVVKGANFTAKRGTAVRNISLVRDNPAHIEGKINGQKVVILTQFVKK